MTKANLKQVSFDYENSTPCKSCRKRTSCLIRPREGRCTGHEEGIPWQMPYRDPIKNDQQIDEVSS